MHASIHRPQEARSYTVIREVQNVGKNVFVSFSLPFVYLLVHALFTLVSEQRRKTDVSNKKETKFDMLFPSSLSKLEIRKHVRMNE